MTNLPVKVLVVDDSAFMRRVIVDSLQTDAHIKVVGYARDGQDALQKIARLKPQVVTMDIEMPVMDGLTALKAIMAQSPLPVIMLSSLTTSDAEVTIKALELGAVDFVLKPSQREGLQQLSRVLPEKVKNAASVPLGRLSPSKPSLPIELPTAPFPFISRPEQIEIVAIGTSTGGPSALSSVVSALPDDLSAGVVIVQHMPPGFTGPLARRLNKLSSLEVKEAETGDIIQPGLVLLARAGKHMILERQTGQVQVRLGDETEITTLFKPAVDVLLLSVARQYGPRSLGVILTGMGNDGVRGLRAIKKQGGLVLAQDEDSSIIFGMPRAAIEAGVVDKIVPLSQIAAEITAAVNH